MNFLLMMFALICAQEPGKPGDPGTPPTWATLDCFRVPACHWQITWYRRGGDTPGGKGAATVVDCVYEGWALRGVGRRVEVRKGGKVVSVTVETGRWHFTHDCERNVVVAHTAAVLNVDGFSRSLHAGWNRDMVIACAQRLKARVVSEKDRQGGREVERVRLITLGDPATNGAEPIHGMPEPRLTKLLESPGAKFRTRTYWFDPASGLCMGYCCGCASPKYEERIDYPGPESVPRSLFEFRVPRNATLEIDDPELGRRVVSEGQKGVDLRE